MPLILQSRIGESVVVVVTWRLEESEEKELLRVHYFLTCWLLSQGGGAGAGWWRYKKPMNNTLINLDDRRLFVTVQRDRPPIGPKPQLNPDMP